MVGETETTLRTNTQQVNKYVKKFPSVYLLLPSAKFLYEAQEQFPCNSSRDATCVCLKPWHSDMRRLSDLTSYQSFGGVIPGWEASQETTAPVNDSIGGSTPLSQNQSHGPCAKAPCHGWDALGLAEILRTSGVHLQKDGLSFWQVTRTAADIIQWPFSWRVGLSISSPTWVLMAFYIRWPFNLKAHSRDSPGGPVAKTLHFKCSGWGFDPSSGN